MSISTRTLDLTKVPSWTSTSGLARLTLLLLLLVILWGAFVRASGSGAGCGQHWPLCNGQVIPLSTSVKTQIEFFHRLSSGLSLIACMWLCRMAFQNFKRGSLTRKMALASLVSILIESVLGAGLVLYQLVAENRSVVRAASLGIHLLSTFFLIGVVSLTARFSALEVSKTCNYRVRSIWLNPVLFFGSLFAVLSILLLGASGSIAALGDTLFPASSLIAGIRQDFSQASHIFIRLRIIHPTLAVFVSVFLSLFGFLVRKSYSHLSQDVFSLASALMLIPLFQLVLGLVNLALRAPVLLQLAHLFVANILWLVLVQVLAAIWVTPEQKESLFADTIYLKTI